MLKSYLGLSKSIITGFEIILLKNSNGRQRILYFSLERVRIF